MSDVKVYKVDTQGKRGVRRPNAPDWRHNQVVRFSATVAENTAWIKGLIKAGYLVEVGDKEKESPKKESPASKKSTKKSKTKKAEKVETTNTPDQVPEAEERPATPEGGDTIVGSEEETEAPKNDTGEETSSPNDDIA